MKFFILALLVISCRPIKDSIFIVKTKDGSFSCEKMNSTNELQDCVFLPTEEKVATLFLGRNQMVIEIYKDE